MLRESGGGMGGEKRNANLRHREEIDGSRMSWGYQREHTSNWHYRTHQRTNTNIAWRVTRELPPKVSGTLASSTPRSP